jgi:hypothetical protein
MRINAKGLHWTPVTLADGTKKTYWYAWRGGQRQPFQQELFPQSETTADGQRGEKPLGTPTS